MIPDRTESLARLNSHLNQEQVDAAVEMLVQFHPADIADLLESLSGSWGSIPRWPPDLLSPPQMT
jgi:hypothetical protein